MPDGSRLFVTRDQVVTPIPAPRLVGVISNPTSFAKGLDPREAAGWPEIRFVAPASRDALLEALRAFAASGVDLVVVAGGDGTLRDVLSALPFAYLDGPPELALIPTGNTNLAARALGLGGGGRGALGRLLRAVAAEAVGRSALRRVSTSTLRVDWSADADRTPLRGFFLGSGAYADGKRFADAAVHGRGVQNGPAVAVTVTVSVLRSLLRRGPRRPVQCALRVDGRPTLAGGQFVFLATALPRLMLGLWPFRPDGDGAVHFLSVAAPARSLWRTVPALLAGAGAGGLRRRGVQAGRARELHLALPDSFVLDGEFFDAGKRGVTVSADDRITFVAA